MFLHTAHWGRAWRSDRDCETAKCTAMITAVPTYKRDRILLQIVEN